MKGIAAKKNNGIWLHLSLLIISIAVAYSRVFNAGFIGWDDAEYVINNEDIRSFSFVHIQAWFSNFYVGNYQPLTIFSYAVDHLSGGVEPFIYHFSNVLYHAATAIVIYLFINRLQPDRNIGLFVALVFALHPVQTESVSWIAERKTVLSGFFYFLALLQYTRYVEKSTGKRVVGVFLFGLAAMLSKGTAVALPMSLLAIDIWLQRDMKSKKVWLEKVPFFAASVIIGLMAVKAQQSLKAIDMHEVGNMSDTVVYAGYAYIQYIVHLLAPINLSVIYSYPRETGIIHYLCLALALGIVALAFIAWRRKWYVLCGGIVFYTVNIVLLLQFIQFGEALMADRYLYIAGVGIFFPVIYYGFEFLRKVAKRVAALAAGSTIALLLLGMTFLRNDIWLSDLNFFSAILATHPTSATAQFSMGGLYLRMGDYAQAEQYINAAINLEPGNYKAWYNKGVLCMRQKRVKEALEAFNRCLAIREYHKAYFSRAMIYQGIGKPQAALADIEKALEEQPENGRAYFIKAQCQEELGYGAEALDNYNKAISFDDKEPLFYMRRGMLYGKTRQTQQGIADLDRAVALSPGNGEMLYFRGIIKYHGRQDPCGDFRQALAAGYMQAQEAIVKACGG
jgi:tetratricopeptide (TPR) repeat protein